VVFALASAGLKEIVIANRTASRARRLAADFARIFKRTDFRTITLAPGLWKARPGKAPLAGADLVVNTSSVGMNGTSFPGFSLKAAKKSAVVSDLVYRPRFTPLLKAAKRRGLKIHTGEGMLLHQGAAAFRLWTGKRPDVRVMKKALLEAMKRG
jgi:shikimate dehydrogenase